MATDTGTIHMITATSAGSRLTTAHSVGQDYLDVADAADFAEDGGEITVRSWDSTLSEFVDMPYSFGSADLENDRLLDLTPGLEIAAEEGDRVDVSPIIREKRAKVVIAQTEEAVTAVIPHYLNDLLEEGTREPEDREFVEVTLINDQWVVTDLPGKTSTIRSADYDESALGWSLSDDSGVQFADVNVVGEMGASMLSTDQLLLNGDDVGVRLDGAPIGLISHGSLASGTNSAAIGITETVVFRASLGTMYNNRIYMIGFHYALASATGGEKFDSRLRYTTDGSAPTAASGILDGSRIRFTTEGNAAGQVISHAVIYSPGADYDNWRAALTLDRVVGSGTVQVKLDDVNFKAEIYAIDLGFESNVVGSMTQISKAAGGADPEPTATYKRTWVANESRSYDGDQNYRTGAEGTDNCFQGYYSGTHGNTRSLVGFDDANIRSVLSGATIKSVKLTFRVKHCFLAGGLNVRIRTHNHTSLPSNWSAGSEIATRAGSKAGSTYTVTLPNSFGTDLKNGNARGIGFGPGPSQDRKYYGYMYGPDSVSKPKLTITYEK